MFELRCAVASEGIAFDARGLMTLVGFEAQAFVVPEFPASISPCAVFIFEQRLGDRPIRPGTKLSFRTTVTGPDSAVLYLHEGAQDVPEQRRNPSLPGRIQHLMQLNFVAPKQGQYEAAVEIKIGASKTVLRASTRMTVLDTVAAAGD